MQKRPQNKKKVRRNGHDPPPGFLTFETSSWILTQNLFFWCISTYWDINFVSKCLHLWCLKQFTSARFSTTWFCLCFDGWISMHHATKKNKILFVFIWAILLETSWKSSAMVNISSWWKTTSLLWNSEQLGELLQILCSCCDTTKQVSSHWIRVKSLKPLKHHLVSQSVS